MSDGGEEGAGAENDGESDGDTPTRRRRQLVLAVAGCAVGAGLTLVATAQTWAVTEGYRPVPFGPIGIEESGTEMVPAVPALALVAIAGAGGILATRGRGRMIVGGLIAMTGLAILVFLRPALDNSDLNLEWPVLVIVAGLLITAAGVFTLRVGPAWPAMGSRYDRARAAPGGIDGGPAPVGDQPNDGEERNGRAGEPNRVGDEPGDASTRQDTAWWDAIDRGEDPTSRG